MNSPRILIRSLSHIGLRLWWVQFVTSSSAIIMESLVSYEILG